MKNAILEKFRRGEPSLGIISHLLSAPAIEVLAYTGMDYVLIDLEHSPSGPSTRRGWWAWPRARAWRRWCAWTASSAAPY